MATISDSLPSDVTAYIQAALAAGKFHSPEEVVATAVREFRDREDLRSKLDAGLRDLVQGNVTTIRDATEHAAYVESIKQRGRDQLNERRRNEGKPPLPDDAPR